MKRIKESILGNVGLDEKNLILTWILENFEYEDNRFRITPANFEVIFENGEYIVNTSLSIQLKDCNSTNFNDSGRFKWGVVGGFSCKNNKKLTNFKDVNLPTKCTSFRCPMCKKLTSLEGMPQECEWFDCSGCPKLTSFKGIGVVKREIICDRCFGLGEVLGIKDLKLRKCKFKS